jgi:hypothetical protein
LSRFDADNQVNILFLLILRSKHRRADPADGMEKGPQILELVRFADS